MRQLYVLRDMGHRLEHPGLNRVAFVTLSGEGFQGMNKHAADELAAFAARPTLEFATPNIERPGEATIVLCGTSNA